MSAPPDIHTIPQEWVDELRSLLDLLDGGPADNDQRARYLLASNFLRDNGAAIAARIMEACR
ncbi:hypothetical protein ACPXB3_22110 [Gordonia sp. DT219]|uniref:hypothetical protein n=1 Tax=Gordonia sp. DT219 TaxID=3416658 RepID=UPI003CEFDA2F